MDNGRITGDLRKVVETQAIIKPWLYALKKLVQARNAPPRESLEVCRAKALERLRVGYLNEG